MATRKASGLILRNGVWHIDKRCKYAPRGRLRESTGARSFPEAQQYLAHRLEELRQRNVYGVRADRTFKEAATKYLLDNQHKASIEDDAMHLEQIVPHIGNLWLRQVHDGALAPFIDERRQQGIKTKTINLALGVVRHILRLAAQSWRDENGKTWLEAAPMISMLPPNGDAALPYPLNWDEQRSLLQHLPAHLAEMALFKVNTGTREQEVCGLRWDWEVSVPELETSVFVVPWELVKNDEDRVIVLNSVARSVIEARRKIHPEYVFTYRVVRKDRATGEQTVTRNAPITKMNNTAWKRAWQRTGLPTDGTYLKGVHNLKHTFGRRLRAAGVALETRKVLLGHTNGDITTHYSAAELQELIDAAERVCGSNVRKMPTLTLIRKKAAG